MHYYRNKNINYFFDGLFFVYFVRHIKLTQKSFKHIA